MEEEQPINEENELGSELTGLNKGESNKKKKQIIIGAVAAGVLVVLIVVVIIIASSGGSDSKNSDKPSGDEEQDDDHGDKTQCGEINLVYDVRNDEEKIFILGEDYNKGNSVFDIYAFYP